MVPRTADVTYDLSGGCLDVHSYPTYGEQFSSFGVREAAKTVDRICAYDFILGNTVFIYFSHAG